MSVGSATIATTGRALRPAEVNVWDPFVRIFHWRLVVAFVAAWATGGEVRRVHLIAGYSVIGLLVVRVVWSFAGTKHARFANFVRGPGAIAGYLSDTARLRAARYLGHNPARGGMIVALLVMLSIIAATGFMMTTDAFRGVAWVQETHETAVSLTLGLVALHILGIIVASCVHGDNLIRAMFTGRKQAGSERLLIPVQERCCWRATSTSPTTALPPRRRDR